MPDRVQRVKIVSNDAYYGQMAGEAIGEGLIHLPAFLVIAAVLSYPLSMIALILTRIFGPSQDPSKWAQLHPDSNAFFLVVLGCATIGSLITAASIWGSHDFGAGGAIAALIFLACSLGFILYDRIWIESQYLHAINSSASATEPWMITAIVAIGAIVTFCASLSMTNIVAKGGLLLVSLGCLIYLHAWNYIIWFIGLVVSLIGKI